MLSFELGASLREGWVAGGGVDGVTLIMSRKSTSAKKLCSK